MSASESPRSKLIKQIKLLLGDQMTEVELDPEHYAVAIDIALERIRQRSDGSVQEGFLFVTLEPDTNVYTLPNNIQDVGKVNRQGVGLIGASGVNFDPFSAAVNNYYLLQWGQTGGLATWELFSEYKETLGRMFASEISFNWNRSTREITIFRKPGGNETVMLTVYTAKPEDLIITDVYSGPWVRDYALAKCKQMLGEAREKFASLGGPQGAVTLNGTALKAEALAEMERLEGEILNFTTSDFGMPFIIG
jgi:hypothetical protein